MDYSFEKGIEQGMAEGEARGIAAGGLEKALDVARKMKTDGLEMDLIMKYSGLSEEELSDV